MSGVMTNEEYICMHLGIDGHVDCGELPNQIYRDIVIIGDNRLLIDISKKFLDYEGSSIQKRFEIVKKQIEIWKSELPLKSKNVVIDADSSDNNAEFNTSIYLFSFDKNE